MKKTAIKQVLAILKKKKTYTYEHILYMKDAAIPVEVKTARCLKLTGLFKFEKIK